MEEQYQPLQQRRRGRPPKIKVTPEEAHMTFEKEEFEDGLIPTVSANEAAATAAATAGAEDISTTDVDATTDVGVRQQLSPEELSAITAMRAEVEALRSELSNVRNEVKSGGAAGMDLTESVGGYPWMLYKFPPNWPDVSSRGWLAVLPGGATPKGNRDSGSYTKYLSKGLIPVTKYGPAPIPTTTDGADVFRHFLRRDASFAKEFPRSQVVAYRWHIVPPLPGLKFPQVEAIRKDLKTFVCEACGYSMDFLPDDPFVGNVYRNHLMKSDKYPHREAVEAVKAQGYGITPYLPRTAE